MKEKTLKTKIKDLPTTGNACCLIRQLAGVSGQKYRDAHRAFQNAKEGDAVDLSAANRHRNKQREAVEAFRSKFGEMTVGEYLEKTKGKAENIAIYWQSVASRGNFSYNWFSKWESVFQKIGEKYGLLEIFRENGIL